MDTLNKIFDNSKVKVIGGEVHEGEWEYKSGTLWGAFEQLDLANGELQKISPQTEESVKKLSHTLGWGLAGLMTFGPAGALAGIILGGNRKQVCALLELKDGRKFLALMDTKIYQEMLALTLRK